MDSIKGHPKHIRKTEQIIARTVINEIRRNYDSLPWWRRMITRRPSALKLYSSALAGATAMYEYLRKEYNMKMKINHEKISQ